MWTFIFRMVVEFTQLFAFFVSLFYVWGIFAICNSLLLCQVISSQFDWWSWFQNHNPCKMFILEFGSVDGFSISIGFCVLCIWTDFCVLWNWRTINGTICRNQWWNMVEWMVQISEGYSKNSTDNSKGRPVVGCALRLWKYFMYTWSI